MKENKRIEYISLASVLSAIAVVFLHSNITILDFNYSPYWFVANIIHSIFIFAVPIFFMISGAMLLDFRDKYNLKTYFLKRINKTVIPYVIWSILGLIMQVYLLNMINISDINLNYLINGLAHGSLVPVYWFFIPLFVLYLVFPVLTLIKDNTKRLLICIVILFILNFFYTRNEFMGYVALALTGYYIHKNKLSRNVRMVVYFLALCGFLMNLFGTYYMSLSIGEYYGYLRNYTNITCILYSVGLFVFIKYDLIKIMELNLVSKTVLFLDYYTFGIYLIHWYIIQFLIKLLSIDIESIFFRLFGPICVIVICVCITNLLRRFPIIKRIVP